MRGADEAASGRERTPLLSATTTDLESAEEECHPWFYPLLGLGSVALSAFCFSIMTTFIKYLTYTMSSMEAIFWRSTGAFFCNLAFAMLFGHNMYVEPKQRMMLGLRCLAGFSSIAFAFYAISQMVLADASVIILTSPVMTFFFGACILHEKIDLVSFICALVAFSGLVFVVRPGFVFGYDQATMQQDGSWVSIASALLGALGQVFVFITVRELSGLHALVIVHYFMLSSAIVSFLWVTLIEQDFVVPSTAVVWRAIAGCGTCTFLGQMFLTKGFQLEKAGIASVMRYLDVVFVFVWDWAVLGERINRWSVVGAAIILSCAVVIAVRKIEGCN